MDFPLDSFRLGSTYYQVCPALVAAHDVDFPALHARVYTPTEDEIESLVALRRKKSLAARSGGERDFYTQRLRYLAGRTVVRVRAPHDADAAVQHGRTVAETVEAVTILATALVRRRAAAQRDLRHHVDLDLVIGLNWRMRSSSSVPSGASGLRITSDVAKRFGRSGLADVAIAALRDGKLATRVRAAISWAREAAVEANEAAAVVKLATALEALLIYGKDPPTRAISERGAFLLADRPVARRQSSRALRQFYELRGQIVHGADAAVPAGVFDAGLQLAVALMAIVAANPATFTNVETIQKWTDARRWGEPGANIVRPRWPVVGSAVRRIIAAP